MYRCWSKILIWLCTYFSIILKCSSSEYIIERKLDLADVLYYKNEKPETHTISNFNDNGKIKSLECKFSDRLHIASIPADEDKLNCYTLPELKTVCGQSGRSHRLNDNVREMKLQCKNLRIESIQVWGIEGNSKDKTEWQTLHIEPSELQRHEQELKFLNREKWDGLLINMAGWCGNTLECITVKFTGKRKYPFSKGLVTLKQVLASNQVPRDTTKTPVVTKKPNVTPSKRGTTNKDSSDNTGAIIGAVFAVFFIIFIVVAFLYLRRRRRRRRFKDSQRKNLTSDDVYAKCEVDINKSEVNGNDKFSVRVHGTNEYAAVSSAEPEYREIEPESAYNKYDLPNHKEPAETLDHTQLTEVDYHAPSELEADNEYHAPSELNIDGDTPPQEDDTYHLPNASQPLLEGNDPDYYSSPMNINGEAPLQEDDTYHLPNASEPLLEENDPDYYSTPISNHNNQDDQKSVRPLSEMYAKVVK